MIIMLDKDNMYSKEMFVYKELIKGFLDKIYNYAITGIDGYV